jgi:oligopeptidase B
MSSEDQNKATVGKLSPPVAELRPHDVKYGAVDGEDRGDGAFSPPIVVNDPWFWLRDDERKAEPVLEHLRAENAYAKQETAHLDGLRTTLYDEHLSHLQETDDTPAYVNGAFFYYTRTVKGKSYKVHCRKPRDGDERLPVAAAVETVLIDENAVAEGQTHCDIRSVKPSPSHTQLVYAVDFAGDEVYDVVVLDLATGKRRTVAKKTTGSVTWGSESTLYYQTFDATLRPDKLFRHKLQPADVAATAADDAAAAADECLFEENDPVYRVHCHRSRSGAYLFVASSSGETNEWHSLALDDADATLKIVQPRKFGLRYELAHGGGDDFIVWTNKDGAVNNRVMYAPIATPAAVHWVDAVPFIASCKVDNVAAFASFVALEGREDGLTRVWLCAVDAVTRRMKPETLAPLQWPEPLYEVSVSTNKCFDTNHIRVSYSSLVTPTKWLDVDARTAGSGAAAADRGDTLIKQVQVLNYDASLYVCERKFADAPDGTKIPMSIVKRRDVDAGPHPLMLYGYGSYEICVDPCFHRLILPYLDRGVTYAIAHIRGGGEMGRGWYEVRSATQCHAISYCA